MIRNFAIAHDMFQTSELIRENRRQKIFRLHALQRRGDFCAATKPGHSKCTRRVASPGNGENRRIEQGLNEQFAHGLGIQITKNLFERKRMLCAERNYDRVVCGRCLKLKIERAAKTLSQSKSPRAIDSSAEWRVKDKLHPARFIEEAFHHQSLLRRNCAKRTISVSEIIAQLFSSVRRHLHFFGQPLGGVLSPSESIFQFHPQIRDSLRQLRCARRSFAQPEWNSWQLAFCIFDTNHTGVDAQNSPRRIPKLKDVARETFHCEILVHGAEESFRRVEHHSIIRIVRNCAAGRQSNEPCTAPPAQTMIDGIMMNQSRPPAALGAETFSEHFHYAVELFASEIAIRPG